jgi:hypothetical protein
MKYSLEASEVTAQPALQVPSEKGESRVTVVSMQVLESTRRQVVENSYLITIL